MVQTNTSCVWELVVGVLAVVSGLFSYAFCFRATLGLFCARNKCIVLTNCHTVVLFYNFRGVLQSSIFLPKKRMVGETAIVYGKVFSIPWHCLMKMNCVTGG